MIIARDLLLEALKPLTGLAWICLQFEADGEHPLALKFVAWSDIAESSEKARVPSRIRGTLPIRDCPENDLLAQRSFRRPITLRGERLLKVLKSLPGGRRLFLEVDENQLLITLAEGSTATTEGEDAVECLAGDLRMALWLEDAPDAEMRFETFPELSLSHSKHTGYAGILAEALSRIKPAVAKSTMDPRYMLAGVNCRIENDGALQLRASDGHCAALQRLAPLAGQGEAAAFEDNSEEVPEALLPVDPLLKALKSFNPSDPVTLDISGAVPLLVGNIYQITLPRLSGVFVNLEQMVPVSLPVQFRLEKRVLLTALDQARATVDNKEVETQIEFEIDGSDETCEIVAKGCGGNFHTTLAVRAGDIQIVVVRVTFGASLLATLINSLPNDEIQLATDKINGPWLLSGVSSGRSEGGKAESGSSGLRLIIMPMLSDPAQSAVVSGQSSEVDVDVD